MPFKQVNIKSQIEKKAATNSEFKEAWSDSRNESMLLHDVVRIRKELNLTQKDLALISKATQQEISRLENNNHSPSLKTLCKIVNSMGYEVYLKKT